MNPLLLILGLAWIFQRARSPMDDAALGAGPGGDRERTGPVPARGAAATRRQLEQRRAAPELPAPELPTTRDQVAAAQAGVVRVAQEMAGGRSPRAATVNALRAALGMGRGRWDAALRSRIAECLGDAGERVSPSRGPEQRAARRLMALVLTRPAPDPVLVRGLQVQMGVPPTGRLDLVTALAVRDLFGRA